MSDYTRNIREELFNILTEKQEKLYASGVETYPTKLFESEEIEEIEDSYRKQIYSIVTECQRITGRQLKNPMSYVKPPHSDKQSSSNKPPSHGLCFVHNK